MYRECAAEKTKMLHVSITGCRLPIVLILTAPRSLLQFFYVLAPVASYVAFVLSLPGISFWRLGCASWQWPLPGSYIFCGCRCPESLLLIKGLICFHIYLYLRQCIWCRTFVKTLYAIYEVCSWGIMKTCSISHTLQQLRACIRCHQVWWGGRKMSSRNSI